MMETKKTERRDPTSDVLGGADAGPKAELQPAAMSDSGGGKSGDGGWSDLQGPAVDRAALQAEHNNAAHQETAAQMLPPEQPKSNS